MRNRLNNQNGAVAVIFILSLTVLIGFVALGTEVGNWYAVRAELSKSVDAAALSAAANISTIEDVGELAGDFGRENFQPGYLGTPESGEGTVSFRTDLLNLGNRRIRVTGQTSATGILSSLLRLGVLRVPASSSGVAQRNKVEIMLILDRSWSMSGAPMRSLKNAAGAFLTHFNYPGTDDKIGLVTFGSGATVTHLTEDIGKIDGEIKGISGTEKLIGHTNMEYAIELAGKEFTLADPDKRVHQYIVFFTDGKPNAFTTTLKRKGDEVLRVIQSKGDCDNTKECKLEDYLGYPHSEAKDFDLKAVLTGDGLPKNATHCVKNSQGYETTRWGSFDEYPVRGLDRYEISPLDYCSIDQEKIDGETGYICTTARAMAINNANILKTNTDLGIDGLKIFVIGLGRIDQDLLKILSSGDNYVFVTPTPDQLESIFIRIAKEIRLRLVQ